VIFILIIFYNSDDGVPIVVILEVGMTFDSEKYAYDTYNTFACQIGLSIRKSNTHCGADKTISWKFIVCNKQGFGSTRMAYNARIQFSVSREGI
jgi:hypothetical protein